MNINKSILVGILFIIIAGVLFISNILNPIVHPITYLFLMGSSKGKDIIFFGLMGFFLISTQIFKDLKVDSDKFLKITLVLGSITLTLGILLEVLFRYQMGIGLNTIFIGNSSFYNIACVIQNIAKVISDFIDSRSCISCSGDNSCPVITISLND